MSITQPNYLKRSPLELFNDPDPYGFIDELQRKEIGSPNPIDLRFLKRKPEATLFGLGNTNGLLPRGVETAWSTTLPKETRFSLPETVGNLPSLEHLQEAFKTTGLQAGIEVPQAYLDFLAENSPQAINKRNLQQATKLVAEIKTLEQQLAEKQPRLNFLRNPVVQQYSPTEEAAKNTAELNEISQLQENIVAKKQAALATMEPIREQLAKLATQACQVNLDLAKMDANADQYVPLDLKQDEAGFERLLKARRELSVKAIELAKQFFAEEQQLNPYRALGIHIQGEVIPGGVFMINPPKKTNEIDPNNPANETFYRKSMSALLNPVINPSQYEIDISKKPLWKDKDKINLQKQGHGFGVCTMLSAINALKDNVVLRQQVQQIVKDNGESITVTFADTPDKPIIVSKKLIQMAETHGNPVGDIGVKAIALAMGIRKINKTDNTLVKALDGLTHEEVLKALFADTGIQHTITRKSVHTYNSKNDTWTVDHPEKDSEIISQLNIFEELNKTKKANEAPARLMFVDAGTRDNEDDHAVQGILTDPLLLKKHSYAVKAVKLAYYKDNKAVDPEKSIITLSDPHQATKLIELRLSSFLHAFKNITVYRPKGN